MEALSLRWERKRGTVESWGVERCGHTATQVGRKVFVIGGYSDEDGRDELQPQYCLSDTETYEWEILHPKVEANLEAGVCYQSATLVEDRILLLGGFDEGELGFFPTCRVRWFDFLLNTVTWQAVHGDLPSSRFRHVSGFMERRREVLIFGGNHDGFKKLDDLYSFHVDKMRFAKVGFKGAPPSAQSSHMACTCDQIMFIFSHRDLLLFVLDYRGRTAQWSTLANLGDVPRAIYGGSMNYYEGRILIYGGVVEEEYQEELYVYDLSSQVWTHANSMKPQSPLYYSHERSPRRTARHIGIACPSKIVMIGGAEHRLDETWELHISKKRP